MTPERVVGVEVPASSANLGPGFDAFAVALDCTLTVRTSDRGDQRVRNEGHGAGELPTGDDNLVWRGFVAYCERFDVAAPDISLQVRSDIPLERGLGSSAAAAVAGVALGRAVTRAGGRDSDLIELAAGLEGHADNAAAAVLGGLVVWAGGRARRLQPTPALRPVLCVPVARQSTEAARRILPAQVPLGVAAANGARAAVVLAGLSGGMAWDPATMTDELHEPARLAAMPGSGALVGALREAGIGACLSGAGPSVLAIVASVDDAAVAAVRDLAGDAFEVRPLRWNLAGAAVCPATVLPSPSLPA
jgi:homoserine kinase